MENIVIWALATGFVTGGTWVGILLWKHQHRRVVLERQAEADLLRRADELDHVQQRLAEVEERMDFAERVLARKPGAPGT